MSKRMRTFCEIKGIVYCATAPYNLEPNSAVERMNRTIFDKIRTLLTKSGLNGSFGAEVVYRVVYLQKFIPIEKRILS